jgi:ATP-binding cassette subfamily C (CFTR/MRP) protein 1
MSDPGRCSIEIEDAFGPIVNSPCFRGFDFTLLFEEGILTILPLGIAGAYLLCLRYMLAFAELC